MGKNSSNQQRAVFIVDGCRTPFLKARLDPGAFSASDLGVAVCRSLLLRQSFAPSAINQLICGSAMPSANEANIGRVISLRSGCGDKVPAWTVQRNCASGLQALDSARLAIALGRDDLIIAGGTDAMSRAPLLLNTQMATWFARFTASKTWTTRLKQLTKLRARFFSPEVALLTGLTDPFTGLSMGQTAENLVQLFNLTRRQLDEYATQSHQRASHAQKAHLLPEVTPLYDSATGTHIKEDNGVRHDACIERLAQLKPMFDPKFGNVTAGNSSQISDGAAFLLLASATAIDRYQLQPLAQLVDVHWAGLAPDRMGLGPVYASANLLNAHQLSLADIDCWEINEAFSAQVLACQQAFASEQFCRQNLNLNGALGQLDLARLNIDGGAIAIGHPVGASGARITLHLAQLLQRQRARYGIASLCIGGGQGGAALLKQCT